MFEKQKGAGAQGEQPAQEINQPTNIVDENSVMPGAVKSNGSGGTSPIVLDLNSLRLSQDFESQVGVRKAILTVPVRKPTRQEFVRVHPEPAFRFQTAVLEIKEERETYLVDRPLWSVIPDELRPVTLFTAINRQETIFLWPVPLPRVDGRTNAWHESAFQAVELAMKSWVRVVANMSLGGYEVYQATSALPEPAWPEQSLEELLQIAFRAHFITSPDHAVIRRLRGEV